MNGPNPNLATLAAALRRRIWLLLALALTTATAVFLISGYWLSPVYSASTTLWVIKDDTDGPMQYSDLLFDQSLTRTYAEVARSRAVAGAALERLGRSNLRIRDLQERVTVTAVRDTQLLSFAVADRDPVTAAALADAMADAFMAEISGYMQIEHIRTVDTALVPTEPVRPRPLLNAAVALLLTLLTTGGLTVLLESMDRSVRTADDAVRLLGLPVLGAIPAFAASDRRYGRLIAHHAPGCAAAEAFRVVRSNLLSLGLQRPLKSILITSAIPGEGKTTTAVHLAAAFAQAGVRVCLVEADLRRPVLARAFGLKSPRTGHWYGLTGALVGRTTLDVHLAPTRIPGLTVLPSGVIPPNPTELLGTHRMGHLLRELEQRFDLVLVDSPPVLAVADAAVLAPRVGGVLLVARAGGVPLDQIARAREALAAVKANHLGVVLAAVRGR